MRKRIVRWLAAAAFALAIAAEVLTSGTATPVVYGEDSSTPTPTRSGSQPGGSGGGG